VSNNALAYTSKEFVKELILSGNAQALNIFMVSMLPTLPSEIAIQISEVIEKYAGSSKNPQIRQQYSNPEALTEDAAYEFLLRAQQGKVANINDEEITKATTRLGSRALALCVKLVGHEFKYDKRPEADLLREKRAALIIDITNHALAHPVKQNLDKYFSTDSRSFDHKVGNKAIAKICQLMEICDYRYLLQSIEFIQKEMDLGGCDVKLSFDDMPILKNGMLHNPELLIAMQSSGKEFLIPILHSKSDKAPFMQVTRNHTTPMFLENGRKEGKEYSRLVAVSNNLRSAHFYAMADLPLQTGLSVPENMCISLVDIEDIQDITVDRIDVVRLQKMHHLLETLWVNPLKGHNREPSYNEEIITIDSILKQLDSDESVAEFKRAHGYSEELIENMANCKSLIEKDPAKTSAYDSYERCVDSIIDIYKKFGILPTMGSVFIRDNNTVCKLADAGITFSPDSNFRVFLHPPRGTRISYEALMRLADMGAHLGLKDVPETAAQALKFAKSRPSQLMHTAYLRHFDFDELMRLAKEPNTYALLFRAFPEKGEVLMPHLSALDKRKVLTNDLDI
jgi:hypothetical protein